MTTEQIFEVGTDIQEMLFPYEETDDPNKRAHIVNPPMNSHLPWFRPGMSGQDVVDTARLMGDEITALCGYKFVPKHNPEKMDACEPCFKVAGDIMREGVE